MNLKRLAEITPIISGFLIFAGFLKIHLYYSNWDINISSYLDFTEILLAFMGDINIVLFFLCILTIQLILGFSLINKIEKETSTIQVNIENTQVTLNRKNLLDEIILFGLIPIIIISFIFSFILIVLFIYFNSLWFLYFGLIFGLQGLIGLFIRIFGEDDHPGIIKISFILIFFGFIMGLSHYNYVNASTAKSITKIELNDGRIITSNENIVLIGKTNNYYFFYDKKMETTIIIPVASVKETRYIRID